MLKKVMWTLLVAIASLSVSPKGLLAHAAQADQNASSAAPDEGSGCTGQ